MKNPNLILGRIILAIVAAGFCFYFYGKWNLQQIQNELMSIPYPKNGNLIQTSQKIVRNRHSCFYFTGLLLNTSNTYPQLIQYYVEINRQHDLVELAWIEGDSITIHFRNLGNRENEFGSSRYSFPIQITPYGPQVGSEINKLLSVVKPKDNKLNYFVLFTVREVNNPFIIQCYFQ